MNELRSSGSAEPKADREEEGLESAVLSFALSVHPALLTEEELITELAKDPASFRERDCLARAIDSLHRAGLLHRLNNFLFPSWAALKAAEIELG